MKKTALHFFICIIAVSLSLSFSANAQSQAVNAQIEGTVSDQTGAFVTNAVITVTNLETGATRTFQTDESGVYRFPLLPLGTYRLAAEAANFKKFVRDGITLATGQAATVDLNLEAGEITEVVSVALDTSIADAGKTDLSRVMNTREVKNLPLIPRNPYNFGLLQANVNGRPSRGFPFPSINANGYARRVNYLLDGNTNTQGDRGSIRFMFISETYVSEVQLLINGFAAEFGNTPGLIMNVITPSGTNNLHGAVSMRFRRPSFYSRPFFYPAADLPDNKTDNFTAAIGAPIIKDRWHFYFGYEWVKRDDKAAAARLLTIKAADQSRLIAAGLPASIFPAAIPALEKGAFYIFRTDFQLNKSNRLTARFNHADLQSKNLITGGINTLERSTDAFTIDYGLAVQLASFTPQFLNEFRFQYGRRTASSNALGKRNESSGTGASVTITGVAHFGSPLGTDTIFPTWTITQFQDNLTRNAGKHIVKFGGGLNIYNQAERAALYSFYTFPTIDAYIAARHGTNPRSYTSYEETFGTPEISYTANFWNFFVQDDWKLTHRLKLNFGLRYDLYQIPKADAGSPFSASQKFNVDKANFAPRFGAVYALREGNRPTLLRFGAGIYTDAPLLAIYRRALQNNGNPKFFTFSFEPNSANAPAFPNTFSGTLPVGSVLPPQNLDTISPDFVNMYALHFNFQIEQAITENLSLAAGFVHSGGRHIPVYRNINRVNPLRFLADSRPVFNATRLDARFNVIQMVESVGVSRYDAFVLQLTKRLSRGLQLSANYTLSKATDDAPEQNLTTGNIQGLVLSDPTNRALDKGYSFADQRHTFVMTMVFRPQFNFQSKTLRYIFNNNQFGIIANANSGERFNIICDCDLNRDGIQTSDRPVGIKRNSGKTPNLFNADLRYSRFINFTERFKLEVFGEFQNFFNINSIVGFNNVRAMTDNNGELSGGLPNFKARNQSTSQESRQFQIGLKFLF